MALIFENENYAQNYKGYLENKTSIQIQVLGNIDPMKYMRETTDMFGRSKL